MDEDQTSTAIATCLTWCVRVVVTMYLGLGAIEIGRGVAAAALNASISNRFQVAGFDRAGGRVFVFDSGSGDVTVRRYEELGGDGNE